MLGQHVFILRRTTCILGHSHKAQELIIEGHAIEIVAHKVFPAHVFAGKLPLALIKHGLEKTLLAATHSIDISRHLLRLVGTLEGPAAHLGQVFLGLVGRAAIKFVQRLGIHQQHIGITHVGIVDARIAFARGAERSSLAPELRPLVVVHGVGEVHLRRTVVEVVPSVINILQPVVSRVERIAVESAHAGCTGGLAPNVLPRGGAFVEVAARPLEIADAAGGVLRKGNFKDRIIGVVHLIVALVDEHIAITLGETVRARADDGVAIKVYQGVVVPVVVGA